MGLWCSPHEVTSDLGNALGDRQPPTLEIHSCNAEGSQFAESEPGQREHDDREAVSSLALAVGRCRKCGHLFSTEESRFYPHLTWQADSRGRVLSDQPVVDGRV